MAGDNEPRSIAAEVALLFLKELEPRIDSDPELLVSSEAILSFAAIKRADPARWDYWRTILTKHQKFELIDYMLCEPRSDGADFSKADLLVRRCLKFRNRVVPRSGPARLGLGQGRTALGELPAALARVSSVHAADLLPRYR